MPKMKYYDESTSQWVTLDAKNAEAITDGANTITPQKVKDIETKVDNHTSNADIHFTSTERTKLSGIAANANNYILPNATTTALGGVKVGTNLSVSSGTISVANASTTTKGVVQLNNTTASTSTTEALAANQGKVLSDKIDVLTGNLNTTNSSITTIDDKINQHLADGVKHLITGDRERLNSLEAHINNQEIHVTQVKQDLWNKALQPNQNTPTNKIFNIGDIKAFRAMDMINWKVSGQEAVEFQIYITHSLIGTLEMDLSSVFGSASGAKIIFELAVYSGDSESTLAVNNLKIINSTPGFANNFYIDTEHRPSSKLFLIKIKKRYNNDDLSISLTANTYYAGKNAFEFLRDINVVQYATSGIPSTVQKDFDARISNFTPTNWITVPIEPNWYYGETHLSVRQVGDMIKLYGQVTTTNKNGTVGTLPVGYRPINNMQFSAFSATDFFTGTISSLGEIYLTKIATGTLTFNLEFRKV